MVITIEVCAGLANPSVNLFLSFFVKKGIYQMLKKSSRCNGKLVLTKNEYKNANWTNSVEMTKIVTNSEIDLQHWPCESRGFKIGSHQRGSIKKVFLKNFSKLSGKHLCPSLFFNNFLKKTPLQAFCCQFCKISENTSGCLLLMNRLDGQKF